MQQAPAGRSLRTGRTGVTAGSLGHQMIIIIITTTITIVISCMVPSRSDTFSHLIFNDPGG